MSSYLKDQLLEIEPECEEYHIAQFILSHPEKHLSLLDFDDWTAIQSLLDDGPVLYEEYSYISRNIDFDVKDVSIEDIYATCIIRNLHLNYIKERNQRIHNAVMDAEDLMNRIKNLRDYESNHVTQSRLDDCHMELNLAYTIISAISNEILAKEKWEKYIYFIQSWAKAHANPDFAGNSPPSFEEFCENDHSEEEF